MCDAESRDPQGQVCRATTSLNAVCASQRESVYTLSLPARTEDDAIALGGWGLLACGVVGGLAGGVGGSIIGGAIADGVYYSDASTPEHLMGNVVIEIPAAQLYSEPPPNMCVPPGR